MRARIFTLAILLGGFSPAGTAGEPVGGNFRISFQQGTGDPTFGARNPALAYNSTDDQFLVVWSGDFQVSFPDCPIGSPKEREVFAQRLDAASGSPLGPPVTVSQSGPACDGVHRAFRPAVAYNASDNEYLVVWHGDDDGSGLVDDEFEIFARRLDAGGAPIEPDGFRISDMGDDGDPSFAALEPALAWNATRNEYLVVWIGDDRSGSQLDDEFEVYGQLLSAAGDEIGANDFRVSDMGRDGQPQYGTVTPAVTWNPVTNQYLVVWEGSDRGPGVGEFEIFGQRLTAGGDEVGGNDFQISFQQGSGDTAFRAQAPALSHSPLRGEYLVVWQGDFQRPAAACPQTPPSEREIFGQRLDEATGALLGEPVMISQSGPACDATHKAASPAATYDASLGNYLVVWYGDDDAGGLANDEWEIFGRRVRPDGVLVGAGGSRISTMGGTGDPSFDAVLPALASSATLVVWHGDSNEGGLVNNELEIFGQRLVVRIFANGFE